MVMAAVLLLSVPARQRVVMQAYGVRRGQGTSLAADGSLWRACCHFRIKWNSIGRERPCGKFNRETDFRDKVTPAEKDKRKDRVSTLRSSGGNPRPVRGNLPPQNGDNPRSNCSSKSRGQSSVVGSRRAALCAAAIAALLVLQISRASAEWWKRAPADFEECADAAEKAATKQEKTAALADCSAKFAGRRKPGGGYTYYDFLQDRSFDIAGPNPTPEEQKYIDQQYTLYLARQRRNSIAAAYVAKQQQLQDLQRASLRTEAEKVPLPQVKPSKLQAEARREAKARAKARECPQHPFACNWPRLSETINDLKKKLIEMTPTRAKGS